LPQLHYDAYFALAEFHRFVRAKDGTRGQHYAVQEALLKAVRRCCKGISAAFIGPGSRMDEDAKKMGKY